MTAAFPSVAVSAPGKVLFTGGYLVVDRNYTGLVLGLSARIHVHVAALPSLEATGQIVVRSPQFVDSTWLYGYRLAEHGSGVEISRLESAAHLQNQSNTFIETALVYVLSYVSAVTSSSLPPSCALHILADEDYYSQSGSTLPSSPDNGQNFRSFGVKVWEAHKTGLGSSAALVTALTGALLSHYLACKGFDINTKAGLDQLHRLAQAGHSAAQRKIGSGFDVASAVFGPCIYRRFSPAGLEQIGLPASPEFSLRLLNLIQNKGNEGKSWDAEISPGINIPPGYRLAMCDVDCGSQTPGMVSKVFAWRKANTEQANALWLELKSANHELAESLKGALRGANDMSVVGGRIQGIRALLRQMSKLSDVPIEPEEQTGLLDRCSAVPGVVGGVVPGAGGRDAVALLVKDDPETINLLNQCLEQWNQDMQHSPSAPGKVTLLRVREADCGIKVEDTLRYASWLV